MTKKSLLHKFYLSGVVFAVALTVVTVVVLVSTRSVERSSEQLASRQVVVLELAQRLKLFTVQVQQYLSDISATRAQDGLDDGFKRAEEAAWLFRTTIEQLAVADPDHASRYRAMLPDFDAYYGAGKRMAEAYISSGSTAGNAMMAEFDRTAEQLTSRVDPFVKEAEEDARALLGEQQHAVDLLRNVIIGALFSLALVMAFTAKVLHEALRRLPRVEAQLHRIASGDLRGGEQLTVHGNDEIAAICSGLNEMRHEWQQITQHLTESSDQLADAVTKMAVVSSDASHALDRQQAEVSQVATAMNEMSATSHEVASSAVKAAASATQADAAAQQGREVVEEVVNASRSLAQELGQAAVLITSLEQESDNIGGILEVIRGIAEQTNLLALNAAIEAARAGEQGRGFAVVADEVRTLAQRTQKSTGEIQAMIARLQEGARKAVAAMERGRDRSEENLMQAGVAGQRLAGITEAVSNITAMNTQIATAAEEQSAVAEEMNRNITNISAAADRTTEGARQIAVAGQQMQELVLRLRSIVSRFSVH